MAQHPGERRVSVQRRIQELEIGWHKTDHAGRRVS
jgi:hypothetical protein